MTDQPAFSRTQRLVIRIVWLLAVITLFCATHLPVPDDAEEIVSTFDKIIHASSYCILTVLTCLAWLPPRPGFRRIAILILGMLLFAAFDEFTQALVHRSPDLEDWKSDASGIVIACVVMVNLQARWSRRRSQAAVMTTPEAVTTPEAAIPPNAVPASEPVASQDPV
jgi:VanZ family protein